MVTDSKDNLLGALYRVPYMGGASPRKLLVNIQSVITLSPDDKRFAFYRYDPGGGDWLLIVADADGTGEQKLASRKEMNGSTILLGITGQPGRLMEK